MSRRLRLAGIALVASAASAPFAATPPATVNYQGVLRNASDKPLTGAYDMTFRFFDALTGGSEILVDTHAAAGTGAVTATNGLFDTVLGGGTVTDGAGPGSYTNLGDVFRDYGAVWVEIKVGAETLSPRVKVQSSAYALNATNLGGRTASGYVDTSATAQTKSGPLTISATGGGQIGLTSTGSTRGGWFKNAGNVAEAHLATDGGYGVYGYGSTGGGYFVNSVNSTNGTLAATDFVLSGTGATGGAYLVQSGGLGQAKIAFGNYGIVGNGAAAGGQFLDAVGGYSDSAYLASGTYGIQAYGSYMGGYVSNTAGDSYAQLGLSGGYGVLGYGSTSGGYFKDNASGAYAYVGNAGFGIKGYGTGGGGFFQDTDNDSRVYAASGATGVYAIAPSGGGGQAGYFVNGGSDAYAVLGTESNSPYGGPYGIKAVCQPAFSSSSGDWAGDFLETQKGVFTRVAYGDNLTYASIQGNAAKNFVQNHPYDATKTIAYASLEGDEVGTYTRGSGRLANGEAHVLLGETFAWVTSPDVGLTAQVTARGSAAVLYVASLSTTELVVRSASGDPAAAFDYVVHGLRVGFEQFPVVNDRTSRTGANLPAVTAAEAEMAKRPDLARYTPLARFRASAAAAGLAPVADDMARGLALRKAIGEYDRDRDAVAFAGTPPVVPAREASRAPAASDPRSAGQPASRPSAAAPTVAEAPLPAAAPATSMPVEISGTAVSGDLLAIDPGGRGALQVAASASDPGVVGIVAGDAGAVWTGTAPLALGGTIVLCHVDASYGAIAPGELLVTSETPGHAMRAGDGPREGRVVAKALEPWPSGTGTIRVLVMAR